MPDVEQGILLLLGLALFAACVFEFINGFHDTANAVATVIYTKSLGPTQAVVLSGIFNFIGVITGGLGVGLSIINLLPIDLIIDLNVYHTIAMVMAILISAILWNFGTWYLALPSSSSHTLIGSILGVSIAFALLPSNDLGLEAINLDKVLMVLLGLIIAPLIGFGLAMLLMMLIKKLVNKKQAEALFEEPKIDSKPPNWIKWTLISTCTLVSFAHGRNDGQKGIGLVMLILIGILPSYFATQSNDSLDLLKPQITEIQQIIDKVEVSSQMSEQVETINDLKVELSELNTALSSDVESHKPDIRRSIIQISSNSKKVLGYEDLQLSEVDSKRLKELAVKEESGIRKAIDYAPFWVILMVSLSLGFGTIFGWKRIVVTIGEKIGKSHLTYAQGASAELVAATTIGLASGLGMPVSTTHTLSSGIAGTMVASKGTDNLQKNTIKNILTAWVLTLPVSMLMSGTLFIIFRSFVNFYYS